MAWTTLRLIIRMRLYSLLSLVYSRLIEEMQADGSIGRASSKTNDEIPTVLVLSYERFRGDIEDLAATGQVRILCLKEHWLTRLMFQFYPVRVDLGKYLPYFDPTPADITWEPKQRYRQFLRQFLPRLLDLAGVDIVISHHVHCRPDFDWGAISEEFGYPYLVINRENLFVSEYIRRLVKNRIGMLGRFEGSYVTVHNRIAHQIISESGFVPAKDIHILGCIRMDRYLKRLKTLTPPDLDKPVITMFTYLTKAGRLAVDGPKAQCRSVHRLLAQIACENQNIEVYLKVKPNFYGTWKIMFDEATADIPIALDQVGNLHISTTIPAHDLIERSNVIIGFNSTTVLEASIANRHVIVPYFGPWLEDRYSEFIFNPDKMHLYDVPSDIEDLKKMILERLKTRKIDDGLMVERRALFEEFVSPLDGSATENHIQLIKSICHDRRGRQKELDGKFAKHS